MGKLKNIFVGFLVSFAGSIPLGYLNIAGLEMYGKSGLQSTIWFALGVISIEMIVIYATLIFAHKLTENKKLMRFIEGFSVLFMFALAYYFYGSTAQIATTSSTVNRFYPYPAYLVGVGLSCINFMQLPFWTGWNLYVLNKKYIYIWGKGKMLYVLGTAIGTFAGMMTFILAVNKLAELYFGKYLMQIVAGAFALLGIFQAVQFWRKYISKKTT
jgi:hypothetical protein